MAKQALAGPGQGLVELHFVFSLDGLDVPRPTASHHTQREGGALDTTPLRALCFTASKEHDPAQEADAPESAVRAVLYSRADFESAVVPLLPQLYRFCLALSKQEADAEDLLEDGLVRAYLNRSSYQARGTLVGWLFQVLRREHEEKVRMAARRRSLLQSAFHRLGDLIDDWTGSAPPEPEALAIAGQESTFLLDALHELPELHRIAVFLCDIEELSYEEASARLGVPVGTVKSRHARGRAKLREVLVKREEERRGDHG
jgi:RNA polymerase sigma-70 factor (ECF subfamily)